MQDISATVLDASRTAFRPSCFQLRVKWDGTNWTDESAYVLNLRGEQAAADPTAGIVAVGGSYTGEVQITLDNDDRRFTPWYGSSPIYAYIASGLWRGRDVEVKRGYYTANLLTNGGFETAGGGGADIWGSWTESAGDGALASEINTVHEGTYAAKLTAGASANTYIYQAATVYAGLSCTLVFWTCGDGSYDGRYKIYDVTHSTDIVAVTSVGTTLGAWTRVSVTFTVPTGCTSVRVYLYCPSTNGGYCYFDAVGLYGAEMVTTFSGILDEYNMGSLTAKTVSFTARDLSSRLTQQKARTALYMNVRTDEFITNIRSILPTDYRFDTVLDYGIFAQAWAWIDSEGLWAELRQMAEAEGGRIYFRYDGKLVFENATHLLQSPHDTSQATLVLNSYTELSAKYEWQAYYNHVEVVFTPIRYGYKTQIWASDEVHRIRAGKSVTVKAQFDSPAYSVITPETGIDYVAVTAGGTRKSPAPEGGSDPISIVMTTYAQQADLVITNSGSVDVYMAKLSLRGVQLLYGDEQKAEAEDTSAFAQRVGKRTLTIKDNLYIQDRDSAQALADFLLYRYKTPRMTSQLSGVSDMPWLELGDRVTVSEQGGTPVGEFFVGRIEWGVGSEGCKMTLGLMPVGLYEHSDYFVIGTNALGNVATKGRYFY